MGLFGAAHRLGGGGAEQKGCPSLKSVTHRKIIKFGTGVPYLPYQNINHMTHPSKFTGIAFFHRESVTFAISRNTDIDYILYLILILTFESLKVVLIIMVAILMISTELATLSLLKIKVFCKRGTIS